MTEILQNVQVFAPPRRRRRRRRQSYDNTSTFSLKTAELKTTTKGIAFIDNWNKAKNINFIVFHYKESKKLIICG